MERQRLAEWEKQRKAELVQHRQREQEKVLELKAKKADLDLEMAKMVSIFNLEVEFRVPGIYKLALVCNCLLIQIIIVGRGDIYCHFLDIPRHYCISLSL